MADLDVAGRRAWVEEMGHPKMRAGQLSTHYFAHLTAAPAAMTDLPQNLREHLAATFLPPLLTEVASREADGGATVKTLFHLFDGAAIETVTMAYPDRVTVCVSSQAGCGMGCPFCATGKLGLRRNLSAAEMVEQVRLAAALAQERELGRLSNVVFMGMGEPLANYGPLVRALRAISEAPPAGLGISARNLTVSTCGLVPAMGQLAEEGLPVRLAVSLHAPDDEARNTLVPVNRRWGVAAVLGAAFAYHKATARRVSVEYALIRGINDQKWRASLLAERLTRYGTGWVHVNPIPLNPVEGSIWTASLPEVEATFVETLREAGLTVTLRDTRGREIDGACGQLAAKEENQDG
ncbi:MAG: 23S rRNA (adenine(2503)-C(2))-methyltransferase RlmN [Bifidobacteriaceae bacterium]|nr:23S rRNA (adenine(2503)-C(2))-methyltransferase RlmN [Bifidobacteriaceae bacterium]